MTVVIGPYWDQRGVEKILEIVNTISEGIPCAELEFRPDREVVRMLLDRQLGKSVGKT